MRKRIKRLKCIGMWMRHKWTVGRTCKRFRCDAIRNKAARPLGGGEIPEIPPESPLEGTQGNLPSQTGNWLQRAARRLGGKV